MSDPRSRPTFCSHDQEEDYFSELEFDDSEYDRENSIESPENGLLSNLPHDA